MLSPVNKSYLYLHLSVFLWGFTAILGAWISLSAISLVWWRVAFTTMALFLLPGMFHNIRQIPNRQILIFMGIGVVVALHWVCFYGAIKLANASVALICMSVASLFTAFIEPWFTRQRFKWIDVGFGLVIIPAMFLTTQGLSWDMMVGFWVGIMAALLAAIFAVLNKLYIKDAGPEAITTIEMGAAWGFLTLLSPALFFVDIPQLLPTGQDIILLLILSVICTVIPFILHLKAFEHLTAFASNLIVNLEPVYGILMAIVLLNEHHELSTRFYIGVLIIFMAVMIYPLTRRWRIEEVV